MSEETPPMPSATSDTPLAPPKTSLAAIFSLVLGILSFCLWILGSIPALILGVIALVKINGSQGQLQGKGLAIAGLVTGGMGLVVGVIMIAIALPAFNSVLQRAKIVTQKNEIAILHISCKTYAIEHDGKFPEVLQDLYPEYIDDESGLKFMNSNSGEGEAYLYFPGFTENSPATKPMIASPVPIGNSRVMGLVGGEVVEVPEEEYQRLMSFQKND